jgi:queuosine precursor transporter
MRVSKWFVVVTAIFITSLLTANIIAVKLVDIFGFFLPAGVVIFPISYIFGDILTEVYGYRLTRPVIWLGFFCNLLMVVAIGIAQALPSAPFWENQAAYEAILRYTPRLLMASFVAYLVGEFTNSYILARLKIITQGRWLWLRTISSTVVGQGLDSVIFMILAFVGTIPSTGLVNAILTQWVFKSAYEAIATPLTYAVTNYLKRLEGIDTYDYETNFNPLTFKE